MSLNRRQFLLLMGLSASSVVGWEIKKGFLTVSEPPHQKILGVDPAIAEISDPKPLFRFVTIGDAGTGEKGQYDVANAMFRYHQNHPFQVVTLLGDNIYINGEIEKINQVFEKPYQPLLQQGVKFYACLGNHDIRTENGDRQVTYPLFNMKGRYYTFQYNPVQFFVLDANENADWEKQMPWLENQLQHSQSAWKIVYSHYPIYSSGVYGVNPELMNRLTPLFKKYGVQLYMNGHEHDYERTKPIDETTYLTSGNGGAAIRPVGSSEWTATAASILGFTAIEIYPDRMVIQAIDTENQVFDQGIILL
ncbi:conserved exported hypothetical protein [Planktothrix serta PCC 8927]|uniref:Calcineurin-like phosphoesterase domain-containing protein n=1 Tax=Planktothrix serta PCC 8927 TaxID=671068 RepID=A0A7Z9BTS9_9CYAN|nr:metallophosphoesterase [Planktothrix serta]VXD22146.1 conserved exported hypothetical protein [Planktothrix serta PCC 8927]